MLKIGLQEKIDLLLRLYEFYNSVTIDNPSFEYKAKDKLKISDRKMIKNFLSLEQDDYWEIDNIINYLEYHFGKNKNLKIGRMPLGFVPINLIFCKKSLQEWKNRNTKKTYALKLSLHKTSNDKLKGIIGSLKKFLQKQNNFELNKINKIEEKEKLRFINTDAGFLNCVDNTTLYNPQSSACNQCINSRECCALLKNKFPKLYKIRVNYEQ